jgi:protein involved in polysaccharide export with SLBB domain
VGTLKRAYNQRMRPPAVFFVAVLLLGSALQAQNQLIGPGDILVVKLVSKWGEISKTVLRVTPEGKIKPPPLKGMDSSEDLGVNGLALIDAAKELQQRYETDAITRRRGSLSADHSVELRVQVVIERGTIDQLLRQ